MCFITFILFFGKWRIVLSFAVSFCFSEWPKDDLGTYYRICYHLGHICGEGNGNLLWYSCLENPRDRGAWWAAVYGVAQSWARLKRLRSSSRSYLRWGRITWTISQEKNSTVYSRSWIGKTITFYCSDCFYKCYVKNKHEKANTVHMDIFQFSRWDHQICFAFNFSMIYPISLLNQIASSPPPLASPLISPLLSLLLKQGWRMYREQKKNMLAVCLLFWSFYWISYSLFSSGFKTQFQSWRYLFLKSIFN